jgi:5-methylcytosine-specific restriction protein B
MEYTELDSAIRGGGLGGYFQSNEGDYSKMNAVFDIEPNTQPDDLKSGIKHYLNFLKNAISAKGEENMEKNLILYGPPGTGKTYTAVAYAVSIIDGPPLADLRKRDYATDVKPRYDALKAEGLIEFTTFHQSYSYEEFIEGLRPVVSEEDATDADVDIRYQIVSGVFKQFCDKAFKSKSVGQGEVDNFDEAWEKLLAYFDDHDFLTIKLLGGGNKTLDIEPQSDREGLKKYQHTGGMYFNVEQLGRVYRGEPGVPKRGLDNYRKAIIEHMKHSFGLKPYKAPQEGQSNAAIKKYVFIIDEINRGDISRVFGELITLIESSKRIGADEEQRVKLPYSKGLFGVPDNVYIIGTMNTADRSIALLDTALRRRFGFVEMLPDSGLLEGVIIDDGEQGIDIARLLRTLNERITILLDREHTIGHSFFLGLTDGGSVEDLAKVFENKILPLLQEYFYDDYDKIRLVLGDNQKKDGQPQFVKKIEVPHGLFGGDVDDATDFYEVNKSAFKEPRAYEYLNQ